jgi:Dyp-type peroxidase family
MHSFGDTPFSPIFTVGLDDPVLNLDEIQGDILVGLQKNFESFIFFKIINSPYFKRAIRSAIIGRITTALAARDFELKIESNKAAGHRNRLTIEGLNVGFTIDGLRILIDPGLTGLDSSYEEGARRRARALSDPVDDFGRPSTWKQQFLSDRIDGVWLITGPTLERVAAQTEELLSILSGTVKVIYADMGNVRPDRGHEHFGFRDGISQPGVRGLTKRENPIDADQGLPGQDLVWPGEFVFGYPGQNPLDSKTKGTPPLLPFPWMHNGSYMVFRRLQQYVPEFWSFIADQARALGMDSALLGARMVGRWKSGAPVMLAPLQDDLSLGSDPLQNNNFEYGTDPFQRRCPYAAHIRKTYPRDDLGDEAFVQKHRIMRAGIPFGPELREDETNETRYERGLMFVCYQTSIVNQFEGIQMHWANNATAPAGKHRSLDGPPVVPGADPIIGQFVEANHVIDEPVANYPIGDIRSQITLSRKFIIPTAAGYFFMPSIAALSTIFTN